MLVDVTQGAHKAPDFLAINPNGMVPALVDGELVLWESTAIARHLVAQTGSDLLPAGIPGLDVERWIAWALAHLGPAADTLILQNMLLPMVGQPTSHAVRDDAAARFTRFAALLDRHLDGREVISGPKLTLADFTLASLFTYAEPARFPMQGLDNVRSWLERMDEVPAWRATAPPL